MALTQKELGYISDELASEQLIIKKYQTAVNQVTDPQLKNVFQKNINVHQNHYNSLLNLLK
ncbi:MULTISPECIES: spore coat protein [Thermoanaerobacterium]|uniref:Coat F domain protein n=2 Tax=Thermoanaerobacterium TaxID=28895 RepID=F6BHS6_THEXL|nr:MULTISPECIES: spore coat protein [Thermoanaerobacterium]HHV73169.1 spore coat protein [Thermoanaerobacterium sp.]AEF17675.1 hypothetical protein Thexy_1646 [Thermoanaerobacterium xylanolyticum LX-11]MBP2072821.1 spore coat protein CotF [Thermoanaerobacterium butyriciformans]MDE4541454.1 spore coat protein [Thermoanaerobacterium sp. R66]ORX23020.1 spore coat protein [Thermoanaerobacterium sp. PSU-2]